MLEVFSLNKVNWLPQYYSQYSTRDHFSLSLCCILLCEVSVTVTPKAVGEVERVHLLPVAIKIFCASRIYVYRTFYIALSTVGDISYFASLFEYLVWAWDLGTRALRLKSRLNIIVSCLHTWKDIWQTGTQWALVYQSLMCYNKKFTKTL